MAGGLGPPDESNHQLLETILQGGVDQLDIMVAGHDIKQPAVRHTPRERAEQFGVRVD
jgi:hypothetical protein